MLAALIIVFREVIEAGLIVGVVLAATQGVPHRGRWIAYGILGGLLGAGLVALFAAAIEEAFSGVGQEMLNVAVLLLAVCMLAWHNAWMSRHGREMAAEMKAFGKDVTAGTRSLAALAIVVGVAVLREGSEVVLFLGGILAQAKESYGSVFLGGMLGIGCGALVSALMYGGLIVIPTRHLFATTSALITLLAAGMAAQAVNWLEQAGLVETFADPLWNTSWLLSEDGMIGRVFHTLVGYSARPTGAELIAYVATVVLMVALIRFAKRQPTGSRAVAA